MSKVSTLALAGLAVGAALATAPASAAEPFQAGDWLIRARGVGVLPDESSTITVIGGKAHADNNVVPEVDFTYFATNNVAFELIAAVTKHDATATGTSLGTVNLGDVWLLPPTLTVQYHFPVNEAFTPYVGAGLNYTTFYDADVPGTPVSSISYGDSFGPALQAGVDIWVGENTTLNLDVKKIWLNTKVKINNAAINADVDLDPWLVGVGLGFRF